jgi:hypothetical protein
VRNEIRHVPVRTPSSVERGRLEVSSDHERTDISLVIGGSDNFSATANDCFAALQVLRIQLEASGLFIGCQGARRNVYYTGKLAQFYDGWLAYDFDRMVDGQMPTINVLDVCEDWDEIVTVEEQRQQRERRFLGSEAVLPCQMAPRTVRLSTLSGSKHRLVITLVEA